MKKVCEFCFPITVPILQTVRKFAPAHSFIATCRHYGRFANQNRRGVKRDADARHVDKVARDQWATTRNRRRCGITGLC